MSNIKTTVNDADVLAYIATHAATPQQLEDSYELVRIMESISKAPAKMWGTSMIGFGCYHYKSDRSRQEGDWPLIAFSPRKAAISLYIYTGMEAHAHLLEGLGKYKMGKACIYIKKLADVNVEVLKNIMSSTITFLQSKYPSK